MRFFLLLLFFVEWHPLLEGDDKVEFNVPLFSYRLGEGSVTTVATGPNSLWVHGPGILFRRADIKRPTGKRIP